MSDEAAGLVMLPKISATAGPTVTVSCAPSMPAGSAGSVLPACAAAAAALAVLKVKTAVACPIAAYVTVDETPVGSVATLGTGSPETLVASAALVTICGCGCLVHVTVPYALS